jgi:hypothetical protein
VVLCWRKSLALHGLHELISTSRLAKKHFERPALGVVADDIARLPITEAELVKAFDARNQGDAFAVPTPLVKFVCQRDSCGKVFASKDTTLSEAAALAEAPLSAKVAIAQNRRVATASLQSFLARLAKETRRQYIDADVYLTSAATPSSASLGWHIDDVCHQSRHPPTMYCVYPATEWMHD